MTVHLTQPELHGALTDQFRSADFRIPLPVYKLNIQSAPWLLKFRARLSRYPWLQKFIRKARAQQLLQTAQELREQYGRSLKDQVMLGRSTDRYTRKRAIPKLRFLAGRMLYLGSTEMLLAFSRELDEIPELRMLSIILRSVATRDVSALLPLGSNAVQSAAQVLSLSAQLVSCNMTSWTPASLQGLAILRLNGISLDGPTDDPLNRLAVWTAGSSELMAGDSNEPLHELACLHGVSEIARHADTLASVFDWDEALAFDVINQVRDSDY